MKYQITIEQKALSYISYFKKRDKIIAAKIQNLLHELMIHPFEGGGKLEPLRFELSGYWSRRITKEHRLVYRVKEKEVTVISCRYHY